MTASEKIYQSILHKLSLVPVDHLQEVDRYLNNLTTDEEQKKQNRAKILALAGSWGDMAEDDFQDYLREAKKADHWT